MLQELVLVGVPQVSQGADDDYDEDYDEPSAGAVTSEQTQSQAHNLDTSVLSEPHVPITSDQATTQSGKPLSSFTSLCHVINDFHIELCILLQSLLSPLSETLFASLSC